MLSEIPYFFLAIIFWPFEAGEIPLWIKIAYTVFVVTLIPLYYKNWGVKNFLWFSDVALIVAVPALWLESSLLASMMAVGVLLPEIYWNIELLIRLLTGHQLMGLTSYMFDAEKPLHIRLFSLFHVILPPVLLFLLFKKGYDPDALWYQTIAAWLILIISYKTTSPSKNVNWVYGPGKDPQAAVHPILYLLILMFAYFFLLFLPTHFLLKWLF